MQPNSIKKSKKALKKYKDKRTKKVLWRGPEEEGVTQSLLNLFLVCRERFRLRVVEGLTEADRFNHYLEYGDMWHICEEFHAKQSTITPPKEVWEYQLREYCEGLCKKYPTQQEDIDKWFNICKVQFPIYVKYWQEHPDVVRRKPLLEEQVFCTPYFLPSGRTVKLKGKWDSIDIVEKDSGKEIWLQENKTKGVVDENQLSKQLTFDLQTMFYLTALRQPWSEDKSTYNVKGVRYNVIRRPLSGGKGSIRKRKPTKASPEGETDESFYQRLREIIEGDPDYFFMRWNVEVTPKDFRKFEVQFLVPILEQLCDWWEAISNERDPWSTYHHCRTPYGIYSPLAEGRVSELDQYLMSGSEVGLQRNSPLFQEL